MKLLRKTIGYQLLLTTLFFVLAGFALFRMINGIENEEVDENLTAMQMTIELKLKQGVAVSDAPPLLIIHRLESSVKKKSVKIQTVRLPDPIEGDKESYRQLTARTTINGIPYEIIIRSLLVENRDMVIAISSSIGLVLLLLLAALLLMNYFMSKRLWAPFYHTLGHLKQFRLSGSTQPQPSGTDILEFRELENAITELTNKVRSDYQALKSFTENASHEIQTPLAIILSKLEMLLQSKDLSPEQSKLVQSAYRNARRLSQTNRSMVTLTRIENRQFNQNQPLKVSIILDELLEQLEDFITSKKLTVEKTYAAEAVWNIDPDLAHILLSNLMGNAVRHNINGGKIQIRLEEHKLQISNSGKEPSLPAEKMFERFQTGGETGNTGLGLAIVKEIGSVSGMTVTYNYTDNNHILSVLF
ncbi:sensor histidine kinase [Prolixibacter denitrificans]|uniref:histidine kinase n=1 Tax=Prolixibacter denitrificans TaxID=1541063 RepID=A0A2P8C5Q6_9BACT|nr:HAMP domain-containing sensor histidine kinase [Prolixibacter denitrificans]PSK80300.1 signal transduction histidine kinase [Prolixibacter denitrificans]GET23110.1 two-component sensor histidine kinase [Prolixibacter denitrificans]